MRHQKNYTKFYLHKNLHIYTNEQLFWMWKQLSKETSIKTLLKIRNPTLNQIAMEMDIIEE